MKIIKHGKKPEPINPVKRFECPHCGCVFEVDGNEYSISFVTIVQHEYHAQCPECDAVANEVLMR